MASKKSAKMHVKKDGAKTQSANKNGKKADSGSSSGSFFTWFIVLALLGVWTSVAVVYFDLVDYQGVLDKAKGLQINLSEALQGKLVAYDTDGDGDFDVEDAKVLLDETPGDAAKRGAKKETPIKDVGSKLREALKQQLAIIHERVEAKKLAKLALAEVREILAKEEEAKELELGRKEISARVKERVATRLKEEEEKIEKEEMEKALEKLRKEKAKPLDEKEEEGKDEKEGEKKSKKGGEKDDKSEKKMEGEGKKAQEEDKGRGKESAKEKRKKSDKGGKN
ncbi:Aspartyl/asparaginyl beta-hydroxylase [Larimichthys crocea]|uniref:Aspartyl/asparaginyl beta-hydroxylase n=1 Tax=Larimichthys crocea TaxID=215358 RepID=A0A6G0IIT5_LARCR|nr:Aspartyl/asparaginyl beta-hydroxylase [Larimichthys crocea]